MLIRRIDALSQGALRSEFARMGLGPKDAGAIADAADPLCFKISDIGHNTLAAMKTGFLHAGAVLVEGRSHGARSSCAIMAGNVKQVKSAISGLKKRDARTAAAALEITEYLKRRGKSPAAIKIGKKIFRFGSRTYVMGILNVTPDSFSDGGLFHDPGVAVDHAFEMAEQGADIIDIGGESTRPGAPSVARREEARRVCSVLRGLGNLKIPVSVDTSKPAVAEEALDAGASMINDVAGGRSRKMLDLAAKMQCPVCLMHMRGSPRTMQKDPKYGDVVEDICGYLDKQVNSAVKAGVRHENVIIDPGIGFGKTVAHNLALINRLDEFRCLGLPVLVGPSRKSFIGKTLGLDVDQRLEGTAGAVAAAIDRGADIVRVHDVKAMVRIARMTDAIRRAF